MLHYRLHCSCFILFPSVRTSLFTFHPISLSPHLTDHVSFLFPSVISPSHSFHLPHSISFMFTLFGYIHITWSFNLIVSFAFQPIPSLEINGPQVSLDNFKSQIDIYYLKLAFGVFTTPCLFILNKKYNTLKLFSLNLIFIKRNDLCCSYNPNKSNISRHLDTLRKSLDLYSAHYENTIQQEISTLVSMICIWNLFVNRIGLKFLLTIQPVLKPGKSFLY